MSGILDGENDVLELKEIKNLPQDLTNEDIKYLVWRIFRRISPSECPFCEYIRNEDHDAYRCDNCQEEWYEEM